MKIQKVFSFILAAMFAFSAFIQSSSAVAPSPSSIFSPDPDPYRENPNSVCGEYFGWSCGNFKHYSSNYSEYYINDGMSNPRISQAQIDMIHRGAEKWKKALYFTFKDTTYYSYNTKGSNCSKGYFYASYGDSRYAATTQLVFQNNNANGYLVNWYIWFNYACNVTDVTIAHELGHVLGLNDLYAASNRNKLMYGVENRTAKNPSDSDVWAAMVMVGDHRSHSWTGGYQFVGVIKGVSYHTKKCIDCNGGALKYFTRCTYNSSNLCKYCKKPPRPPLV